MNGVAAHERRGASISSLIRLANFYVSVGLQHQDDAVGGSGQKLAELRATKGNLDRAQSQAGAESEQGRIAQQ